MVVVVVVVVLQREKAVAVEFVILVGAEEDSF